MDLNASNLGKINLSKPTYTRDEVPVKIAHFGVGAFHRSHQAIYLDALLEQGSSTWGICGIGVMPQDKAVHECFRNQDGLYTLTTIDSNQAAHTRVVGSIVDYVYAPDDPQQALNVLCSPDVNVVTLTITEGGYSINEASGKFEASDPLTLADLQDKNFIDRPRSVLGFLTAALSKRRALDTPPFTVVSCDNIEGNGQKARAALVAFANQYDPTLANWIDQNVAFPSSMVDRITPSPTAEAAQNIAEKYGVQDDWALMSEDFIQWVLEDDFCADRPELEKVGVQIVSDVRPYELMKLRILNASHQVMSYLGSLHGYRWVHDVCTDPIFLTFLRSYVNNEAIPTLPTVSGIDLSDYAETIFKRFQNHAIKDTLERQMVDASDRIPKFLLPVLRHHLANNGSIAASTLTIAAWSHYVEKTASVHGTGFADRRAADLMAAVQGEDANPGSFLDLASVFGDLGENAEFRQLYIKYRSKLASTPVSEVLAELA